jgi:hypothetical protein
MEVVNEALEEYPYARMQELLCWLGLLLKT